MYCNKAIFVENNTKLFGKVYGNMWQHMAECQKAVLLENSTELYLTTYGSE